MIVLLRRTVSLALRPPYNWGPEFASQFVFGMKVAWFPMIIASLAFTYGPAGIQAAGFLKLFGALDRLGGLFALIVMREFAPLVCAIVMAGVVGTRGQWRVVEYPTSASAGSSYAKECSRFVSEGFSDYRD